MGAIRVLYIYTDISDDEHVFSIYNVKELMKLHTYI